MGHKGIRDGGPPRRPGFRPEDVIGQPVKRALLELAHEGYETRIAGQDEAEAKLWLSTRVTVTVEYGLVTAVAIG
ncbi:hypothetical protein [Amycolatopsis sp. CA-230715]|uniref:hypothetical protein n=1 Tax=Amycolatopsis sp. CA-230715 TaxID=2745196 RepID=UPI001C021FE6|nr:hypothetical protein [Amycolatopsis sp. CA-230715]QWF85232.1 hypothetical protein HUW46_08686 [Amycolatopsis sp. CA-230715]